MDVITIESSAYNKLIDKINEISVFVKNTEIQTKQNLEQEIKREQKNKRELEQEQKDKFINCKFTYDDLCFEFDLSIKTFYRLRKNSIISSSKEKGRCIFKLAEIEKALNYKLISCTKEKEIEFRKKYNLNEY